MEKYQYQKTALSGIEASPIPYAVYQAMDERVVTVAVSAGFCRLFGFEDSASAISAMDNDMYRLAHPDDAARVADGALRFAREGGRYEAVYRTRTRVSPEYRIIHAVGEAVSPEPGVQLRMVWYTDEGIYTDSGNTRQNWLNRSLNDQLRHESRLHANNYDALTGLPNMNYFFELVEAGRERMREKGQIPALLFIDLSGMKFFNRKYGFTEGDRLICAVSKVLARRFSNENCSRFGQDHFAVYTRTEGLEATLTALFEECRHINDGKVLPVRVGVYLDAMDKVDVSTACDRAKVACDDNRNTYVSGFRYFDTDLLNNAVRRQYIIDNLDRAIAERWINVFYQPIVRAANGRVSDEEALARWNDPERGMLTPAEFIPILEDTRLIYKLDLYVVDRVLEKMRAMGEGGLYIVPQSVNLSRADFDVCDIVEEIRRRVDDAGIERDKLTIELTESVVGSDFEFMRAQVARLKALGFHVWMDDFGSGYSSLDLLQSIHFDLIKLDMRFMQQFDNSERSRIILTELIKMAIALGVETVTEGVERKDQVDFLKEIGCTKLQGFYYSAPNPIEEIFERNRRGIQIGFENPAESEYYASLGRINLYDFAVVANEDAASFQHYFDTLPMAVLESDAESVRITRCNKSFREFLDRSLDAALPEKPLRFSDLHGAAGTALLRAVKQCDADGSKLIVEEPLESGDVVHAFFRWIATNPVTGVTACAAVILSVENARDLHDRVTYAHIAQALASDYFNLYYVDLDTDQFIEYSRDSAAGSLAVERHGEDFFTASRRDALLRLYAEDREMFRQAFTKRNILKSLKQHGAFTLTYRLLVDGAPLYVSMKASRISTGGNHIIIGVSDVDAQMRQREALERVREERVTYNRVAALSGDYICFYTVDPVTDHYVEYSASRGYEGLDLAKRGDDFFEVTRRESERTIHPEDLKRVQSLLTKGNVLAEIAGNGLFVLNYRLMMDGKPHYVCLKGAMVEENGKPLIIMGVSDMDAQVRRDREYEHNLSEAQRMANRDALTGVKNKHAYVDMEAELNYLIEQGEPPEFAVAVFDVNGLKQVNDTQGHQAGDRLIRQACAIICQTFSHSPVFRVGGDEFAVISRNRDYERMDELMASVEESNRKNAAAGDGAPVIAGGMARYSADRSVEAVFERADANMYADKNRLKGI